VRDAIDIVFRHLAALPPSPTLEGLRVQAEKALAEVDAWPDPAPPPEERDRLMVHVLDLHAAVRWLEQKGRRDAGAIGAAAGPVTKRPL
jgi:hypothetical protein